MTIDEAIKFNEEQIYNLTFAPDPRKEKAYRLNIEALKEVQHLKTTPCWSGEFLLPGETKD